MRRLAPPGVLLLSVLAALDAPAASAEEGVFPIGYLGHFGPSAAAMGGAFTAVADDATAFYWNPAGYAFGSLLRAGVQWGDDEMDRSHLLGGLASDGGGAGPLLHDRASGFSFGFTFMGVAGTFAKQASTLREGELLRSRRLDTFDLAVSILHSLPLDNLVVAANVHYLDGEAFESVFPVADVAPSTDPSQAIFDEARLGGGASSRTGTVDVAALYAPARLGFLRVGFTWRRLVEPGFRLPSGEEIVLPRHARAGVAFVLPRATLLAFDVDVTRQGELDSERGWRELSLGVSKNFFDDALSLRAGLRAEAGSSSARPAFSLGAGGRVAFVRFDVAYLASSDERDDALWFGVSVLR